jgi:hypothetical protein
MANYVHIAIRYLHVVVIAFGVSVSPLAASGEDDSGFVAGVEDLPLMPGLHEVEEAGTKFDSATGRIVEAYAVGQVEEADILAFYAESLPQLGWTMVDQTLFHRSGESLKIETSRENSEVTVHFSLSPQ